MNINDIIENHKRKQTIKEIKEICERTHQHYLRTQENLAYAKLQNHITQRAYERREYQKQIQKEE